jgi:hypothetical protein
VCRIRGPDAAFVPTVSATWPAYEHVNVQVGLDAWLAAGHDGARRHGRRRLRTLGRRRCFLPFIPMKN